MPVSDEVKHSSIPSYTLAERKRKLTVFEVAVLDNEQQKAEFKDMFNKKLFFEVKEVLYRAWLSLKFAAAGTETEAFDDILPSKHSKSVPKRKKRRMDPVPDVPACHDPSRDEWIAI